MIAVLLYGLFCIWFAWLNAKWIKAEKRIYHGWNGLLHLAAAGLIFYFFGWKYGVATLFVTRLIFDTSLNLFRDLPIDYVPVAPKSIVDKVEKFIFKSNGLLPKILYLLIIVILFTL